MCDLYTSNLILKLDGATASRATMEMDGVDLLRVENGRIAEVWLFSADQKAEDAFWGTE